MSDNRQYRVYALQRKDGNYVHVFLNRTQSEAYLFLSEAFESLNDHLEHDRQIYEYLSETALNSDRADFYKRRYTKDSETDAMSIDLKDPEELELFKPHLKNMVIYQQTLD